MADLTVTRYLSSPGGTCSHLELADGTHLFGLELPWRDNAMGASCIPGGSYVLVPYLSAKHGQTWAFVGAGVGVVPAPGISRTYILIHPANVVGELRGCVAPGRSFTDHGGRPFLLSSRDAFAELSRRLGPGRHTALVQWS